MSNNIIWIVGAGNMGYEYAKILATMGRNFWVIGRSGDSVKKIKERIDCNAVQGGIQNHLGHTSNIPEFAIIAVNDEELARTALLLLRYGVKKILIEKPAGLNRDELLIVSDLARENNAKVYVAYNRRFYASVEKAKNIIDEDEGILSFIFEFTEWSHEIARLNKSKIVLENWLIANSSHVIDLAFYMGGKPVEIKTFHKGGLSWHPSASIFSGAGITEKAALFSYSANWESAGRWSLEILTKKHRLIFRPLENLQIQNIGSISTELVKIEDTFDTKFKAGLYKQIGAFLTNQDVNLCSIEQQLENFTIYEKIKCG